MAEQTAQEPTMEEILASIRRIISEDEPAAGSAAAAPAPEPKDDVLELTNRIEAADLADMDFDAVEPEPAPAPRAAEVETSGDLEIAPAPKPKPARAAPKPAPEPAVDEDSLISAPAAAHVTSAFSQLSFSRNTPIAEPGLSLESVVRELLKPMLREWLDAHLPGIVEARVQAEVERLSRGV